MRVRILGGARDDLIEGYRYYEKREAGLGNHFLSNLFEDIESLGNLGGIHPQPYRNFHRALSERFPFAVCCCLVEEAVVDCRRSPSWIRRHLKDAQRDAEDDL